jgi:hypothetical protein
MWWTVTAMDIRMACVLPGAVGNVSEFCRQRGISRQTYYKWQKRFAQEGEAGLADRSRRPRRCPHATPVQVEEEIVGLRKQLAEDGEFNGPVTIAEHLLDAGMTPPDRSTIARILARRGLVTRQPRKRPRSSYHRFEASRPNEMWQSDCTGWKLTNGRPVAIAGTLDDHCRVAVGLRAGGTASGELVWAVMVAAIERWGVPMSSLSESRDIADGRMSRQRKKILENRTERIDKRKSSERRPEPGSRAADRPLLAALFTRRTQREAKSESRPRT